MTTGKKIKDSPVELKVIKLFKAGLKGHAISKRLKDEDDFDVSGKTVDGYIKNFIMNDEKIREKIGKELQEQRDKIEKAKSGVPDSIGSMINNKQELIQNLKETLEEMEDEKILNKKIMEDKDILNFYDKRRKIIMSINKIQNYQNKYIIDYNINDLLNKFAVRILDLVFEHLVPHLKTDKSENVIESFKTALLNEIEDFKVDIENE